MNPLYLLGGWAGSLVALWLYLTAAGMWHVHQARVEDAAQCKIQIEQVMTDINTKTEKSIEDAQRATSNITIDDNIVRLCKQSDSCREHNSK